MLNFRFVLVRFDSFDLVRSPLFCLLPACINEIIPRKRQNHVLSIRGSPVIYPLFYSFLAALLFARRRTHRLSSTLTRCLIGACGVLRCLKIPNRRLEWFSSMFPSHWCGACKSTVAVEVEMVVCKFPPLFSLLLRQLTSAQLFFLNFHFSPYTWNYVFLVLIVII